MITIDQFVAEHNGNQVEVTGSNNAKFQCVDLVNAYIRDVLGLPIVPWTNAQDFPLKCLPPQYEFIQNTEDNFPLKGDIPVWKSKDGIGHIAACIEDGNKKNFRSIDQNWSKKLFCTIETHVYSSTNYQVIGWLRAKKETITMSYDEQQALKIIGEFKVVAGHGNLEGAAAAAVGAAKEIQSIRNEISELKGKFDILQKQFEELSGKYLINQKSLEEYQLELGTAKETISKFEEQVTDLTKERGDYKRWYEDALTKTVSKTGTKELVAEIFNRNKENLRKFVENIIRHLKKS